MHEHLIKWLSDIIKKQKEECTYATMLVIIFWNFTMLQYRSNYSNEKANVRAEDLTLRGNIRKILNLGGDPGSVSLPEMKFGNSSQKARTNRYQTFLVPSSFSDFLYFVRDCSS